MSRPRTHAGVVAASAMFVVTVVTAATASACAGNARRVDPASARTASTSPTTGDAGAALPRGVTGAPEDRRIAIALTFDDTGLHVRVRVAGPPGELRAWTLGEDPLERIDVRDEAGRQVVANREGRRLAIDTKGAELVVAYAARDMRDVRDARDDEDARRTVVEAARFRAVGERILALPVAFEAKIVDAEISIDGRATDAPVLASSFGVGKSRVVRSLRLRGSELRRAAFLGGGGGRAEMDAPEGHDEAAWLGYTAFDPRAVAAEVAGFRGVLHEYFKGKELEPATFLLAVDARPRGRFRVLRRASGLLVALAGSDAYDAALRLAVAHELVHAWIGEQIWLGDATPGREAESYWFHEGVTRWVAREQLARVGLLSPDEYAAEIDRLLGLVTTSRHGGRSTHDLAVDHAGAAGVTALLVARGTLFATLADARVREASRGARSFDDVVRQLAKQAELRRGPLPADALHLALVAEIGEARATSDFDDVVTTGKITRLPDAALGPCFESREVAYDVFEPGFDVAASKLASAVRGLDPTSAAAKAGLRDGDVILSVDMPDRPDVDARIDVEREGARMRVAYPPRGGKRKGQAFRRRPSLTEQACRTLMLRR